MTAQKKEEKLLPKEPKDLPKEPIDLPEARQDLPSEASSSSNFRTLLSWAAPGRPY